MRATAIVILLAVFVAGYHGQQKHPQSSDIQRASQRSPAPTAPVKANPTPAEQKECAYRKTLNYLKKATRPEYFAAWVLVIAAGIGLYVTWRTAKAAFLNAQAVLDSERPWLVVMPVRNEASPDRYYFFFRVTNKGRTPAKLVSGNFSQAFLFNPNKLPVPAKYNEPFLAPNDRFLPPEGYFDIYRTEDERTKGISPQAIIKSRPQNDGPSTDILLFYGNLVYDDVLGKKRPGYEQHETRWCFAFFPDGMRFVRTGPDGSDDEYNCQT